MKAGPTTHHDTDGLLREFDPLRQELGALEQRHDALQRQAAVCEEAVENLQGELRLKAAQLADIREAATRPPTSGSDLALEIMRIMSRKRR